MARPKKVQPTEAAPATPASNPTSDLAAALVEAIRSTQPITKKDAFNKKHGGPWASKDGKPKPRLKRKAYHHALLLGDPSEPTNKLTAEEITLFNQLKPGKYCNGYVTVSRRRGDKGIDIDYPIRTSSQRLRLVNDFGIRSFAELLQRCVTEAAQPKPAVTDEDD